MASCLHGSATEFKKKQLIKISMVDDDHHERQLIKHAVDRSRRFDCVGIYSGGTQALEYIPSSASEVVLMDVRMPGMPGTECARELKRIQPDLPIIMISGFDDPRTLEESMDAGADGFWAKRHPAGGFLEALAVWVRRRKLCPSKTGGQEKFLFIQTKETRSLGAISSYPSPEPQIRDPKSSAETEHGLSSDAPAVRNAMDRIVIEMEGNFHTRQDLLQEARVQFWSRTRRYPRQRLSWHLEGVRFHLKDLKKCGRSVDSDKRRGAQTLLPDRCEEWDHWRDTLEFDEGFMSAVNCRDILDVLARQLKGDDKRILGELADGLGVREIARRMKLPHQSVIRSRKRIAALAIKLGIVPPPAD